jgi:hypothetical protein
MTRVGQWLAPPTNVLVNAGAVTISDLRCCTKRPGRSAMYGLTFIQCCVVCRRPWLAGDERWRAYHVGGEPYEPSESIIFYCPECAVREFDRD